MSSLDRLFPSPLRRCTSSDGGYTRFVRKFRLITRLDCYSSSVSTAVAGLEVNVRSDELNLADRLEIPTARLVEIAPDAY